MFEAQVQANLIGCLVIGVASTASRTESAAVCMMKIPLPRLCRCEAPDYTEMLGEVGLDRIMGTMGAANANPDEFVWGVLNHLVGSDSPEYFRRTFLRDPSLIPGGVVEGVSPGSLVNDRSQITDRGLGRVASASAKAWAVGAMDSLYNKSLGFGGVAQVGVAGITGESEGADRGHKPRFDDPIMEDGMEDSDGIPWRPTIVWRDTEVPGSFLVPCPEDRIIPNYGIVPIGNEELVVPEIGLVDGGIFGLPGRPADFVGVATPGVGGFTGLGGRGSVVAPGAGIGISFATGASPFVG